MRHTSQPVEKTRWTSAVQNKRFKHRIRQPTRQLAERQESDGNRWWFGCGNRFHSRTPAESDGAQHGIERHNHSNRTARTHTGASLPEPDGERTERLSLFSFQCSVFRVQIKPNTCRVFSIKWEKNSPQR